MGTMVEIQPTQASTSTTTTKTPSPNNSLENVRFSIQNFLQHKTGESIDAHYKLGELLGEGGFGVVYRGTHTKTGAIRAIKRMEKDPRDQELNQEIINEFNFLKELDHPNLLKAYDMFEDQPHFYIVSDLYGGGDVLDYLEEAGFLPEDKVKLFMNKLLSCIDYLHHNRQMVHRDLKLENILLDDRRDLNDMKLIDFGLALHFDDPKAEFSDLVGSTSYVSPQVIEGIYTCKCDIWSCGVIAFGLLAGYTPFDGGDDGQTLQEILIGRVDFNDPVWDPVSDEAKDFICNLLAYDEEERPTAQQALTHPWLQQFRQDAMDESLREIDSSLRESIMGLHNFRSKGCKLKQAACAIMASQLLSKDEREAINDDFRYLNRSMGGSITKDDLKQSCIDLAMDESTYQDAIVDSIFEHVNYSGSGAISYSEFTIAMMFEQGMVEDKLPMVFDMLDTDDDGKISNADLQAALNLDDTTCAKMLQPLNLDDNEMLSYDNFQEHILSNESFDSSNFLGADSVHRPPVDISDSALSAAPEEVVEEEEVPAVEEVEEVPEPEPEPPKPEPEAPKEEPKPEGLTLDEKVLCITWYHRFGRPDRKRMIHRIKKMGDECDITEEQVMQLPWIAGGSMIHVKEINAIMAAEATPDGDIVKDAKLRRRSSVREMERQEMEASLASLGAMDDSLVNLSIKEDEVMDHSDKSTNNKLQQHAPKEEAEEEEAAEPVAEKPPDAKPEPTAAPAEKPVDDKPKEETKTANKPEPSKNMNPNRNLGRAPLKVSSVLSGSSNHGIQTETTLDKVDSSTGKKQTVVKSRPAQERKERSIFSPSKKGPDFDWLSMGGVKLKVASIEERQKMQHDFDWVSLVKSDEMSTSISNMFSASRRKEEESAKEEAAQEEPLKEEPVKEENAKEEAAQEEPVKEERPPVVKETVKPLADNIADDKASTQIPAVEDPQMSNSMMDISQLSMDESDRNNELEDTVHTGHASRSKMSSSARSAGARMSSSARSTASERRRGSNIYKPGRRSSETEKMKFPKNRRRSSTATQSSSKS